MAEGQCVQNNTEKHKDPSEAQENICIKVNEPYIVTKKSKASLNVRIESDLRTCSIDRMCQLPNGNIVLCDGGNGSLKLLDTSYKVINHCALVSFEYSGPYDVCVTDDGQVAVTLITTVQFMSVSGNKLAKIRSFETPHDSYSIAYLNDRLYVSSIEDHTVVFVYNTLGALLRRIHFEESFSICQIKIDSHFQLLYVASFRIGLVTVDLKRTERPTFEEPALPDGANPTALRRIVNLNAHIIATFKDPDLPKGAEGLCIDKVGNVFVGAWGSTHNILQVSQGGDAKVTQVLSQADGIKASFICFDKVNNRLLVTSCVSDTLSVLDLIPTSSVIGN